MSQEGVSSFNSSIEPSILHDELAPQQAPENQVADAAYVSPALNITRFAIAAVTLGDDKKTYNDMPKAGWWEPVDD